MATVTAGMTVSIDGFVADPQGSASRLYPDLADLEGTDYMNAAIEQTGAVVMGRRTFEMGDPDAYVGNYEFQVPIFVVTHHPPAVPPKQDEHLTFTFVTHRTSLERLAHRWPACALPGRSGSANSAATSWRRC